MNRRRALYNTGVAVAGGAIALTLGTVPQRARAEGSMKLPNQVEAYTDSGMLKYVAIWARSEVIWRGFETEATHFTADVNLSIENTDGDPVFDSTIHEHGPTSLDDEDWGGPLDQLSGSGKRGRIQWTWGMTDELEQDPKTDWHIIGSDPDDYGPPANPASADVVYVPNDHNRETFAVELELVYRWYDGDPSADDPGDEIYAEAFQDGFRLRVNNVIAHAEGGSSLQGGIEAVADNSTAANGTKTGFRSR